MTDNQNHARIAYEAYLADAEGKTLEGQDIPDWSAIGNDAQRHWAAAANALVSFRDLAAGEPTPTVTPVDVRLTVEPIADVQKQVGTREDETPNPVIDPGNTGPQG